MLELRAVACVRGGRSLFKGFSQTLLPGQLMRVRGANGAGKTSLLRLICGLALPAEGDVLWAGLPITRLREEFNRQMVYIGHGAALKDDLSAVENLQVAAALAGLSVTSSRAREALAAAGLQGRDRLAAPARHLSQGQRRRVALARLVLSPRVPLWVLDEPFNALDVDASAWLSGLLETHVADAGLAVLTSHQDVRFGPALTEVQVLL